APGTPAAFRAANPAQGFTTALAPAGPILEPADAAAPRWALALTLSSLGCPGAAVPAGARAAAGNRLEYRRGAAFTEWYVNGPRGLEQGFTLAAPPPCARGPLALELTLDGGLVPELAAARDAVVWRTPAGGAVLRYGELVAHDARGRELPSHLALAGDRLTIHVDATAAAYPVTVDPIIATLQAQLLAGDGTKDDNFGNAVALAGDTAVIGAFYKDGAAGLRQGAAYVFVHQADGWAQQAKLLAGDATAEDEFGWAVALAADTAVVGAYYQNGSAGHHQGAAYVFVRQGVTWTQQAKLTPTDAAADDDFGYAVALAGDTAVVGAYVKAGSAGAAQGAAYVFVRQGATWTQQAKLLASDGAANDAFGYSVALAGDTLLVGADGARATAGSQQGAVYVFTRAGAAWTQRAKLVASDGAAARHFGAAVALDGGRAVVGAPTSLDSAGHAVGAAYVFAGGDATWAQQARLTASDGGERFGGAVAVAGDTVLVGSGYKTGSAGQYQGAAYAFAPCGGGWIEEAKLQAADGRAGDRFGTAVALADDTAIAGAPLRAREIGGVGQYQGAAYAFLLKHANGDPCAAAQDCASGLRVDGVCCDRACTDRCEACDVPGSAGTCTTVASGPPHGGRSACPGSGVCQGFCDGTSVTGCAFPGPTTPCGAATCVAGVATAVSACDGSGTCAPGATRACGDYACGATDCKTTCSTDADCAPGRVCANGVCVVPPDGGLPRDGGRDAPPDGAAADAPPGDGHAGADAASDGGDINGNLRARGCECRAGGGGATTGRGPLLLGALVLLVLGAGRRRR
ncbi:MAG TPA: FG-GAP repeat protein, partial [Polyangia bacterium]